MDGTSAQEVVDALPDGVVVANASGTVIAVSHLAATWLGWESAAEALGRPLADVLRLKNSDGAAWLTCNSPYVGLATRTAVPEQSWSLPDGTEVLVTARLHRERPRGELSRLAISIRSGRPSPTSCARRSRASRASSRRC